LAAVVGVVHDLARAAAVARGLPGLAAARVATEAFAGDPIRAFLGWSARGLAGLALLGLASWATTRLGVGTSVRLSAVAALHQLVLFALVYLRADWLAEAIRRTTRELPFSGEA
jgi:hypothetical protein